MFVLSLHRACKEFEFLCASINQKLNSVSCRGEVLEVTTVFFQDKLYGIFRSCELLLPDDISRFIRHCIRIRQYFHGNMCKVDYMKGALRMYNENVSEL